MHRLPPGHERRPHGHVHGRIALIVSGAVDVHIGAEVVRLSPGAMTVIPPDLVRHAVVVGEGKVIDIDVFTPNGPEHARAHP